MRPADVVVRIGQLLRRLLGDHVELVVDAGDASGAVRVDPVGLERGIVNLAVNARDAMPGGGTLTVRVADREIATPLAAVDTEIAPGAYVVISVEDTGVGMDEATATHIFEPFFTTRARGGGSGLGLASFHGFVRQVDGHIVVETAPGAGTRFDVYLPRAAGQPEPAAPPTAVAREHAAPARILLAEDDARVRSLVARVLVDEGYDVHEATGPADAFALLAEAGPFDLVVSDVSMPDGGGVALLDRIEREGLPCPVLFISGFSGPRELAARMRSPRVRFLAKPFLPDDLLAAVRRQLDD